MELHGMKCEACLTGAPLVTHEDADKLNKLIPDWNIVEQEGMKRLERVFKFPDFAGALDFTNRVGKLAEENNHHPAILTEWGKVTVQWWTHKIGGLHMNDFIMAAKTDELF
ncbi:4a-hydroxytetrahydrobiopterin dehydratase [Tichowtungia aerotolerans]|uniref:Putative pterin-4-alpha-carbinolamine dehydratase n=1 Tax=Tichowtungia aerotolerans TaxID=2697043 RepID=A0A6P1M6I9_9BACT|nr:4a-hydroxytetrahydrobiopterin dehydratase [Tichowtungia aerotolerans]QHI69632.1 4a-hydroxytetrahydrobiopterin dehydratase [Tichowtungia aerotolerans]